MVHVHLSSAKGTAVLVRALCSRVHQSLFQLALRYRQSCQCSNPTELIWQNAIHCCRFPHFTIASTIQLCSSFIRILCRCNPATVPAPSSEGKVPLLSNSRTKPREWQHAAQVAMRPLRLAAASDLSAAADCGVRRRPWPLCRLIPPYRIHTLPSIVAAQTRLCMSNGSVSGQLQHARCQQHSGCMHILTIVCRVARLMRSVMWQGRSAAANTHSKAVHLDMRGGTNTRYAHHLRLLLGPLLICQRLRHKLVFDGWCCKHCMLMRDNQRSGTDRHHQCLLQALRPDSMRCTSGAVCFQQALQIAQVRAY